MRSATHALFCAAVAAALVAPALASSVQFNVVTDGRHAVFAGSADGTDLFLVGANPAHGAAALAPERYAFDVEDERYVYLVVWANRGANGVLAELLFNGVAVLSGDPAWQVYTAPLMLSGDEAAPSTSEISQQIRRATRRFAWVPAAVVGGNGVGIPGAVDAISSDAAWMWAPPVDMGQATPVESTKVCLLFRISPQRLWPEIELWHEKNVGVGPEAGWTQHGDEHYLQSGGGGGGGSSGSLTSGSGSAPTISDPFTNYEPRQSSSTLPTVPEYTPSDPVTPDPPITPEPSSAFLMLAAALGLRRRR